MGTLGVSPAKKFAAIFPPLSHGRPAGGWGQACFISRIFRHGAAFVTQQREFSVFRFSVFGCRFRLKRTIIGSISQLEPGSQPR
jgi:hypothetical protein